MEADEVELNYTLNLVKLTETMSHYFSEFNQLVIYSYFTRFFIHNCVFFSIITKINNADNWIKIIFYMRCVS